MTTHEQRLQRARDSLEGLAIGDALGGFFEGSDVGRLSHVIRQRILISGPWRYTDDTNMALSVYETLRKYAEIRQQGLAVSLAMHFHPGRGYGMVMRRLLSNILLGIAWDKAAQDTFGREDSYGHQAALRGIPVGAYFADDVLKAVEQAQLAASVTHSSPEASAGAAALAAAAAQTWQAKQAGERPSREVFIARVLPFVPPGDVRYGIEQALRFRIPDIARVVGTLGSGSLLTPQDTVPFVLWCAGEFLDNYEEAIWKTASGGGAVDTTCAMVGGIVALYTGIEGTPAAWRERLEPLPVWALREGG